MNIIEENKDNERISLHSHITGLGLDENGYIIENIYENKNENIEKNININDYKCNGMIGQKKAREAAGIFINLIKEKNMCKCLLLAGPSGSGKTAIAIAISKEINNYYDGLIPFCIFNGSQVYSCEVKKTEILTQYIRKSIGVKIKEVKEVFEGEVMDMEIFYDEVYEKNISHVIITLRTLKEEKKIKIHNSIYQNLQNEKVEIKDVIYIECQSGNVKRIGKCNLYKDLFDIENDIFVDLPKGNVHKKKSCIQNITLHDLDLCNTQPKDNVLNFFQNFKTKKTEITHKLRNEINKIVYKYVDQGIAQINPGVLFIDEVHMLDIECFTYLNRTLESNLAPVIILATNRGICNIKGTNIISAHGIPIDLLDRLIIVKTLLYNKDEILQVLKLRCKTEKIKIDYDALEYLADAGVNCSLRYAIQLLTPAKILAKRRGLKSINKEIVEIVFNIFFDSKRSIQLLLNEKNKYVY